MTDQEAISEFAKTRSNEALTILVNRYIDLVYSTVKRLVRDEHLAQDVTQAVFIVFARRAPSVNPKYLAGWLINTSRLAAREAIRTRNRQQRRDIQAARMRSEIQTEKPEPGDQLLPLLDDALARLSQIDRSSVVMRFFQGRTFSEVGQSLGVSDEAARKRVDRAVEKLRSLLCKQGIAPSVGAVVVALTSGQAKAAPAALASQVVSAASSNAASMATAISKGVVWSMSMANAKIVIGVIAALSLIGGGTIAIVAAQARPAITPPSTQATTKAANPSSEPVESKIHPHDRLMVWVDDLVGLGVTSKIRTRVEPSGKISMPLIGQIQADGKTPAEVEALIADAYRREQIISNANVKVDFLEQSPNVTIQSAPLQVGDHVLLHVLDLRGLGVESTAVFIVDAKGSIDTPPIYKNGHANPPGLSNIAVAGLTEFQTQKKLEKAYSSSQVLANAQVWVERISAEEAATYNDK